MFLVAPSILSWGVRFYFWREFTLAPADLIAPVFFLPITTCYSWIIASKKAVSFRRKVLWIAYLILIPAILMVFRTYAIAYDNSGFTLVFGGIALIVVSVVLLGFTIWLSFNLAENPDRRLTLIFKRLAFFVLSVLAVLIGITVFKVIT